MINEYRGRLDVFYNMQETPVFLAIAGAFLSI